MCYYYLLVLVAGGLAAQPGGAATLPVLIADHDRTVAHLDIAPNPLHALNINDFSYIVREAIRRSEMVLIFVEEKFRMEDVSIKDQYGSPFFHLEEMLCAHKLKFLPAVADPYETLTKILPQGVLNVFHVTSKTRKLQFFSQKYKYYYLFFQDDVNVTRAQALREHDRIIKEVYFAVRQLAAGPVVAFYTGVTHPSASARKQVVDDRFQDYNRLPKRYKDLRQGRSNITNNMNATFNNTIQDEDGHFLFSYGKTTAGNMSFEELFEFDKIVAKVTSKLTDSTLIAVWTWSNFRGHDFEVTFNFTLEDDGWKFEGLTMNAEEESTEEITTTTEVVTTTTKVVITTTDSTSNQGAGLLRRRRGIQENCAFPGQPSMLLAYNNSIVCNIPYECTIVTTQNESITIIIHEYQIQVSKSRLEAFDDPVKCPDYIRTQSVEGGSYITPGIAAGLLVSLIWVGLMTAGIVMMMSINSNDKFDNAQGAQLLFSEG